jgi:hypothetical protein
MKLSIRCAYSRFALSPALRCMEPNPKSRPNLLRIQQASLELEKSELNTAIASPFVPLADKREAISRYVDLCAQLREVVSELESLQVYSFRRRLNANGRFDSICLLCYANAASGYGEDELRRAECNHVCDADALRRHYKRQVSQI